MFDFFLCYPNLKVTHVRLFLCYPNLEVTHVRLFSLLPQLGSHSPSVFFLLPQLGGHSPSGFPRDARFGSRSWRRHSRTHAEIGSLPPRRSGKRKGTSCSRTVRKPMRPAKWPMRPNGVRSGWAKYRTMRAALAARIESGDLRALSDEEGSRRVLQAPLPSLSTARTAIGLRFATVRNAK